MNPADDPGPITRAAADMHPGAALGNTLRAPKPPGMIQDALDRNGNILVKIDQLNNQLDNMVDRMVGPRPSNAPAQPESPEGSLNQLAYQQAFISEKLEELQAKVNEVEALL